MAKVVFVSDALKVFTVFLCVTLVATAIFGFISIRPGGAITYDADDGVGYVANNAFFTLNVLCAYLILLALMILAAEFASTAVLNVFAGLISPLGRGIVYILVGLLVFGLAGIWGFITGILWMLDGVLHVAVGYRSFIVFYSSDDVADGGGSSSSHHTTRTTTTTTTTTSAPSSTEPKRFCKKCGAKLQPNARFCSECREQI